MSDCKKEVTSHSLVDAIHLVFDKLNIKFLHLVNTNYRLVASLPARRIAIAGCPKFASHVMLCEQLYCSNHGIKLEQIAALNVNSLAIY